MDKNLTQSANCRSCHWFDRRSSPRLVFLLGAIIGGLVVSLAGVVFISYLYNGGKFFFKQPDLNINASTGITLVEQPVQPLAGTGSDIEIGENDYIYGNKDAEVSLIIYSDFECQLCRIYHRNLIQFADEHKDKVKVVMKNFVLTQKHPQAYGAAIAALCAGEQNKYYEYADKLFNNQSSLSESYYLILADELALNRQEFTACQLDKINEEKINIDYQEGLDVGVRGIPNTIIIYPDNTLKLIDGNVSKDFLSSLLKEYL